MLEITELMGNTESELLKQSMDYMVTVNKCSNDIKIGISTREGKFIHECIGTVSVYRWLNIDATAYKRNWWR